MTKVTIEICAGSYQDVLTASSFPIQRIELNSALELGGLTPSPSQFLLARKATKLPIVCMIRPRPAGFHYNRQMKTVLLEDAKWFLENGADGIVFGALTKDNTVDVPFTTQMVQLIHSYQKEAVFHKAIDQTIDFHQAIIDCVHCGIDRILTSGQAPYPNIDTALLKKLHQEFQSVIQLMPGGGVNASNITSILNETGIFQIHLSAKSLEEDPYDHLSGYYAVDAKKIAAVFQALQSFDNPIGSSVLTGEDEALLKNDVYEEEMSNGFDDEDYNPHR